MADRAAEPASDRLVGPQQMLHAIPDEQAQQTNKLTTFEQALIVNSIIILGSTVAAYWVTHQVIETYHFLIDTVFVLLATLVAVGFNAFFLRRTFAPLLAMQATIQAIQAGATDRRAVVDGRAADVARLATTFNAMLDALDASRRARLREIAAAQEEERRRLALELHDATGQELTALILRLEVLGQDLADPAGDREVLLARVEAVTEQAQQALQGVQALARQLRPSVLDDLGLAEALRWLGREMSQEDATQVQVVIRDGEEHRERPHRLAPIAETMLFRVAQEGISNAIRHSGARKVALALARLPAGTRLTLSDDGCGFDVEQAEQRGTGLRGMRERMAVIEGRLEVRSRPGAGTTIVAWVPLSEQSEAAS
jgi:two-component system sensor histidine kinase UhpB